MKNIRGILVGFFGILFWSFVLLKGSHYYQSNKLVVNDCYQFDDSKEIFKVYDKKDFEYVVKKGKKVTDTLNYYSPKLVLYSLNTVKCRGDLKRIVNKNYKKGRSIASINDKRIKSIPLKVKDYAEETWLVIKNHFNL